MDTIKIKYFTIKLILIILLSICYHVVFSQEVGVSLYNNRNLQGVVVTIQRGEYIVYDGNKIIDTLYMGNNISVVSEGEFLVYRHRRIAVATNNEITLRNIGESTFFINYSGSVEVARTYEGWLKLTPKPNRILALNYVDLESYVAGVVESVSKFRAPEEYYKTKAVIVRTIALYNINNNYHEGFDLCDGTHCQSYNARSTNLMILRATNNTANKVIIDNRIRLIRPYFHVNSGGQTINMGFYEGENVPYLKSVQDDYSQFGINATWTHSISQFRWREFLIKNGVSGARSRPLNELMVIQNDRQKYFELDNNSIKISDISSEFGLKSNLFSMHVEGSSVIFQGKGEGSGIGLSLESAVQMAGTGFSYEMILEYFYNNITIVNLQNLSIFNMMKQNVRKELPQ